IKQISKGAIFYSIPQSVFTVIIDNLIRNALQHGTIGDIQVKLSDRSIQILNPQLTKTEDSNSLDASGYGIGLMIVERICQRLNWQLKFNNGDEKFSLVEISINDN
ncbi:MAG: sensor histidine kinase, partial [Alcanivoracaceae bacterium]|nr:sensor histidine kinase [Alcanivoracaceae bacterium]